MQRRMRWFRDAIVALGKDHGDTRGAVPVFPVVCRCGSAFGDVDAFHGHIADSILELLGKFFTVVEFDQQWQTVYGCQEAECIIKGLDRELHQHRLDGLRIELREKAARPLSRNLTDGTC